MQTVPVLAIRNKILSALLKHSRLRAGSLPDEYAEIFHRPVEEILSWESGSKAITLSELEVWAYASGVPLTFFWDENALPSRREFKETVQSVMQIRRKMVGVLLRQGRLIATRSLEEIAHAVGISPERLAACEAGRDELSVAELELAAEACGVNIADFFDEELFPISEEERRMRNSSRLQELPPDLQDFPKKVLIRIFRRSEQEISQNICNQPVDLLGHSTIKAS